MDLNDEIPLELNSLHLVKAHRYASKSPEADQHLLEEAFAAGAEWAWEQLKARYKAMADAKCNR